MKKFVLLLIIILLVTGCSVKKIGDVSDAERFAGEYEVEQNKAFKYVSIDEVIHLFEQGTGIVFFGNSDEETSQEAVKIFNQALHESNISDIEIYYYNPSIIRDDSTEEYYKLIHLLGDNLTKNDYNEEYLFLPDIYFISDGKIIDHNNAAAFMIQAIDSDLVTDFKRNLKNEYIKLIKQYKEKDATK